MAQPPRGPEPAAMNPSTIWAGVAPVAGPAGTNDTSP